MRLSTRQQVYLRGLGQPLRPQLHIGHAGVSAGTLTALEALFRGRELVKVRVLGSASEAPASLAEALARESKSSVVGIVGRTFVLYRPNPDLKERITLPESGPRP